MTTQQEAMAAMLDWFRSSGGYVHPSVEFVNDPITGLSAFSTAEISPDERLISCPFELVITAELATKSICKISGLEEKDLMRTSSSGRESWSEAMRIAAYLCLHWVRRDNMHPALVHKDYVQSLPRSADLLTPLYFNDAELSLLQNTNLIHAVRETRQIWEEDCETVRKVLKEEGITWDRFRTAMTYLSSRAFPSKLIRLPEDGKATSSTAVQVSEEEESHPVLIPGLDLLNHTRAQPILWLSSLVPGPSGDPIPSISLVSTRSQAAKTQLYNNYGPKPNDQLLLAYGFVIDDNPDDTVALRLGSTFPPNIMARYEKKNLDPTKRFILKRDGLVDPALLDIVRTSLEEDEEEIDEEDVHGQMEKEQKDMQLELDVLGFVGQKLEDEYFRLQAEIKPVEGEIREEVRRMCEVYRKGQSDILGRAMDLLEERTANIEELMDQGMGGCHCCS
ncbi:hypothetical protein P7C73_g4519, partial [Tremellales sp. Uapishka_1]